MRTTAGCVIAGLLSFGCGSEPVEGPYVPRVCDTDGPIRLLDVETPQGVGWSVLRLGDRLVASWYGDDGGVARLGAYVVDRCGGDVVQLPEYVKPFVVDDALWGCNVQTGTLSRVDAATGEVGEPEPGTFDCTNRGAYANAVFLADGEQEHLVLLDAEGPSVLDIELEEPSGDHEPDFPFFAGRYGFRSSEPIERVVRYEDGRRYRVDVTSGSVDAIEDLPPNLYRFEFAGILASETDLFEPGTHQTTILDEMYRPIGTGPTVEGPIVASWGPVLVRDDAVVTLPDGATHPPLRHLDAPGSLRLLRDWFVYSGPDGFHEVWDYRTDTLIYVFGPVAQEFVPPSFSTVDEGLQVDRVDGAHGFRDRVVELVDPDTREVDEVLRFPRDLVFLRLGVRAGGLILPSTTAEEPAAIEYVDTDTFETTVLATEVDSVASAAGFEITRDDDLYFVRYAGEDAGLWRTLLPPG